MCFLPSLLKFINCDRDADAGSLIVFLSPLPPRSMEKFDIFQPTRLYAPDVKTGKPAKATTAPAQFVGRLPTDPTFWSSSICQFLISPHTHDVLAHCQTSHATRKSGR